MAYPPFVTDLAGMFGPVSDQIVLQRSKLGYPALVAPSSTTPGVVGALLIGQEWLRHEHSPPRIVLVPVGSSYEAPTRAGIQPYAGAMQDSTQKLRKGRWLLFEAHLWGDPDSTFQNALQDFNACIELERELLTSMSDQFGGTTNIKVTRGEFKQPTDENRAGRVLVLSFGVWTAVVDLPWTFLAYATSTTAGVSVATAVAVTWPDGSSTQAGVIVAPPK